MKAKGSTRNAPRNTRPKHRGWKENDGSHVTEHKILATQLELRYHPGLNVNMMIFLNCDLCTEEGASFLE